MCLLVKKRRCGGARKAVSAPAFESIVDALRHFNNYFKVAFERKDQVNDSIPSSATGNQIR